MRKKQRPMARHLGAWALALAAGCAAQAAPTTNPDELQPVRPGVLPGYLPMKDAVNSLALLPPPPAPGSAQQKADDEAYRSALAAQDTPRWQLAAQDAVLRAPAMYQSFACAAGFDIDPQTTPHLAMLLRRTAADAGFATYRAKNHYNRTRPFMAHNGGQCTPEEDATLRKDGSYPSGHAALGWAIGLALTEVLPQRADALVQRAYAYGQSRVACGVHWQSDVDAGRLVASGVFAQLHNQPDFVAQLALAREEVAKASAAGRLTPPKACETEARALGPRP